MCTNLNLVKLFLNYVRTLESKEKIKIHERNTIFKIFPFDSWKEKIRTQVHQTPLHKLGKHKVPLKYSYSWSTIVGSWIDSQYFCITTLIPWASFFIMPIQLDQIDAGGGVCIDERYKGINYMKTMSMWGTVSRNPG